MKKGLTAVGLAAAVLASSQVTVAEEPHELEAVRVGGDWLGANDRRSLMRYPGGRTRVSEQQLQDNGALNLEDALREVPGVQVLDETGTGILPNIGVRGLNPLRSQRLQVLMDGYPIAIGPYTNIGLSLFPVTLEMLEQADLVRGGAAVHYGPNNVGGVLNLHSREIPLETRQFLRQKITISEQTGNLLSDSYYRVGGYLSDRLAMQLQLNALRGDGFRDHSDTKVDNLVWDGQFFATDAVTLKSQLQYYQVEADLPGALTADAYRHDRTDSQRPYDRFDADMVRGTFTYLYQPDSRLQVEWRNFAHRANRTFWFGQDLSGAGHWADPGADSTHVADSPRSFTVAGTEPRLTYHFDDHSLTVGARYVSEKVDFDVNREELSSANHSAVRDWRFHTDAVAAYVSDTFYLMDRRLLVTPGVRFEKVNTRFADNLNDGSSDNQAEKWLPGLTLSYQLNRHWQWFANTQRSLVPVQVAQVIREGDVGNEVGWNYETGVRFNTPALYSAVTLFRIDYDDQIQFNNQQVQFENLGATRHQGVELESRWQLARDWDVRGSYTWLDSEQRNGDFAGNDVPNAPRHQLSAGLHYQHELWNAALTATHTSSSYSDAANTHKETANGAAGKLPAYTLVNTRVARQLPLGQGRAAEIGLAVNNLTDEAYYFRGVDVSPVGRLPGPGRAYMVDMRLSF
ncbi:Fe(3+) dicitrate transport protein [Alloalcanivorax xenomutans]|uniref:TonB-dependent receptor family protein n=1 Tax=Alloalcanivorax xenomutans TaxID=1094342 RepID=UPI000BC6AFCB|nr:TonB-dependent siderophore receptor [Alloalcanivorax xenomutans]SOB90021.1 Fe(3+) dicitrate transport protein [Alloalcanivorax xenomutans]